MKFPNACTCAKSVDKSSRPSVNWSKTPVTSPTRSVAVPRTPFIKPFNV